MKKLLLVIFVFCCVSAKAQYQKPYFNTLSIRSGLPEAKVESTLEDKDGYIWMGTQNGLVRYDGYQLKLYSMPSEDGLPVAAPLISNLHQDKDGKIWAFLGTGGFYYYDRTSDKFVKTSADLGKKESSNQYKIDNWIEDAQDPINWVLIASYPEIKRQLLKLNTSDYSLQEYSSSQKGNNKITIKDITGICKDANGKIWITGDNLLCYYNPISKSFKKHFELPESLKGNHFYNLSSDPINADVLWLNTDSSKEITNTFYTFLMQHPKFYGTHLLRFNIKTKTYQVFNTNNKDPNALSANCWKMLKDSLNRLWFLTDKGVSLFDAKHNNFRNYDINFPRNNGRPTTIVADKQGNCWIGGEFLGLYYLNTKTVETTLYNSNLEAGSLPFYQYISELFFDRSGTLWVNMPYFGIAYLDKKRTLLAAQPIYPSNMPEISKNTSKFKIVGAQGDSICYIADSSSLYAWHTQKNIFDKIDLKKEVYKSILTVIGSSDGLIWIGTGLYGLFQYNPKTKYVINYINIPNDSNSISSNDVTELTIDTKENVWIGTDGDGLCSFNTHTKKFTRYPYTSSIKDKTYISKELNDNRVLSLLIDHTGLLWIGTNNGFISSYNTETKVFTNYVDTKKGLLCALVIFEDSKQRLWIGSYLSGLFLFDRKTGTFKNYTEKDGLLYNGVYQIQEDEMGNIWCVGERGLSRLNPSTTKITGFMQAPKYSNSFFYFIYKDAANTFRLNGGDGIIHFNPADLKANPVAPSVVIESLHYHPANNQSDRDSFLYPQAGQKIELHYNENKIGFQFIALQFDDPANNQYSYQLVGYDKDWIATGTQRTTTYTNLSPGTYTFKVKAANSDGVWNNKGVSISIVILPPWWETWWAYVLYVVIFITGISWFIAYRSATLKKENKVLEEKVNLRTSQLQKSIEDLKSTQSQLVQSEKMASLGELTAGIAHEIQNPLNFVNNFSELNTELIDELEQEVDKGNLEEVKSLANDIKENEQKINHHGKRADAIVKGMLQHSRKSTGIKEPTDINALADEYLRLAYHGLRAKDKSFNAKLETDFDESIGKINIVPQDLGRVILNLITNAFYACTERSRSAVDGYQPTVSVSTKRINDKVEIKVSDNGKGIPQSIIDKIYQPFFTTKPTGEGTGLGLSMSYEIITKGHGGQLKVETKENEGTTFIIQIPVI